MQQAVAVSGAKLFLWHWSQPVAYLVVFHNYFCVLSPIQIKYGMVVAAREMLYIATTIGGVLACPSYLLLDISTVWAESDTKFIACGRIAMYILTPHNFVAMCLTARFSERGSPRHPRHRKKLGVLGVCLTVLTLKCATLTDISTTSLLWVAVELVSLGVFISVIVSRNLYWTSKHRKHADDPAHLVQDATDTGCAHGAWYCVSDGGEVAFRYSPDMSNRSGLAAVPGELIFAPHLDSFVGEDTIEAVGCWIGFDLPDWICTEMGMWVPLSLVDKVPDAIPKPVQERAKTYHRLSVKQYQNHIHNTSQPKRYKKDYWHHMKRLYHAHIRTKQLQRQHVEKGPLASIFLSLALVQVLADFCSCFALANLLQQANETAESKFEAPLAMRW